MKKFLLTLALTMVFGYTLGTVTPAKADGSDPMPICRPQPGKPCPKPVATKPEPVLLNEHILPGMSDTNRTFADGGPIPLCPICRPGVTCCGWKCMNGQCTK